MYKRLLKNHRGMIILGAVISLITSLLYVGAGYSLSMIYTDGDNSVKAILCRSGIVVVIWIVTLMAMYYSNVFQGKILCGLKQDTREEISKKIESLRYDDLCKGDTGNYVAWYTTDINTITEQGYENIFSLVEGISITVFSFVAMVKFGVLIAVVSIILFALAFIVPQITGKKLQEVTKKNSVVQEQSVEKFKDAIQGFEELMLAGRLSLFEKKISTASRELEESGFSLYKITQSVKMLSNGVGMFGQMIMLIVTAIMVGIGITPVGAILAIGNLSGTFFNGLASAIQAVANMSASNSLMDKFEVLNEDTSGEYVHELEDIRIEGLSFAYEEKTVFENVNMLFEKGKKYALVGQSGSGKSTVARILLHELEGYSGDISINGKRYSEVNRNAIFSLVGIVSQNVFLFEDTIRNNITLGADYSDEEVEGVLEKVKLLEFVNSLDDGLNEVVKENGKNYSGGQRQRMAIARALIRKPQMIIMDEGTSALDQENSLAIEEILLHTDVTVLFITHHLHSSVETKLANVYRL